jgi:hypothetical protein
VGTQIERQLHFKIQVVYILVVTYQNLIGLTYQTLIGCNLHDGTLSLHLRNQHQFSFGGPSGPTCTASKAGSDGRIRVNSGYGHPI